MQAFFLVTVKLIEYIFLKSLYVLIFVLDLFQELKCLYFTINMNRRTRKTRIYSNSYQIAAKPPPGNEKRLLLSNPIP